jgi:anti-sigma regulatory factor (Ser/Thr protein kinase)
MPQDAGARLIFDASMTAAPEQLRRLRRAAARTTAGPDQAETVELVISELLTNALTHAAEPYRLRVWRQRDVLRVEVEDSTPGPRAVRLGPKLRDNLAGNGRGLRIVDRLSRGFGVLDRGADGKTVWAEIAPTLVTHAHFGL